MLRYHGLTALSLMNPGRVNTSNHKIHEKISKIVHNLIPEMQMIA